jgi:hypothetical protein
MVGLHLCGCVACAFDGQLLVAAQRRPYLRIVYRSPLVTVLAAHLPLPFLLLSLFFDPFAHLTRHHFFLSRSLTWHYFTV